MQGPKLTRMGHQQARRLGKTLSDLYDLKNATVRVSPLRRARQTWRHIRSKLGISRWRAQAWGELREIDLFEWEGRAMKDIASTYPEQWQKWKFEPWNMELESGIRPVPLLLVRAAAVWARLCYETPQGGTTLVVAHGALNKAVLIKALGVPDVAYRDSIFQFSNCAVAEVEIGDVATTTGLPGVSRWRWLCSDTSEVSADAGGEGDSLPGGEWRPAEHDRSRYGV